MCYFLKKHSVVRKKNVQFRSFKKSGLNYVKNFKNKTLNMIRKDLSRFVKWPRYIRVQKEKKIFYSKLKIPSSIAQFSQPLDKNMTKKLMNILSVYRNGHRGVYNKNVVCLKHGINNTIHSIKKKKALFVIIANDVNPVELVIWLPTICQKSSVPFCIIKNKSGLGKLLGRKSTSCVTITLVSSISKAEIKKITNFFRLNFSEIEKTSI